MAVMYKQNPILDEYAKREADRFRQYLFEQARLKKVHPDMSAWYPEDTTQSMQLGWMLGNVPGTPYIELYCSGPEDEAPAMVEAIKAMAPFDYICGKAMSIMTGQLLKYPDYPFSYSTGRENANAKRSGSTRR